MDELDQCLFSAWQRVAARVRADRLEAARRAARQGRPITRYTMRPWCLCLRASDTRLLSHAFEVAPTTDDNADLGAEPQELIDRGRPHRLTLRGPEIRQLLKPVRLPWPGERARKAAGMLGITVRTLHHWIKVGSLKTAYNVGTIASTRGKPGPHVYGNMLIDPNGFLGRPPDALWGSLWQTNHEKLPEAYELVVQRRARTRMWRGEEKHRGWNFICPGRFVRDEHGERHVPCGRAARRLFIPVPPWTIAQAMNDRLEIDSEGRSCWSPGFGDPLAGLRAFACKRCWRVRSITLTDANGWNEFITHITGGLLYGHEVERPTEIVPPVRKHRFTPRVRERFVELRERILPLLLDGLTYKQIASRLDVTHGSVMHHVHVIYLDMGATSREKLRELVAFDERHAAIQHRAACERAEP